MSYQSSLMFLMHHLTLIKPFMLTGHHFAWMTLNSSTIAFQVQVDSYINLPSPFVPYLYPDPSNSSVLHHQIAIKKGTWKFQFSSYIISHEPYDFWLFLHRTRTQFRNCTQKAKLHSLKSYKKFIIYAFQLFRNRNEIEQPRPMYVDYSSSFVITCVLMH